MNAAEKNGPILQKGKGMIGISLAAGTAETLLDDARRAIRQKPDLIEWRADLWEGDPREALQGQLPARLSEILGTVPLLYTYRTREEGGRGTLSGKDYKDLLHLTAHVSEVDLIDVEVLRIDPGTKERSDAEEFPISPETKDLIRKLRQNGTQIIASSHEWAAMPDTAELEMRLRILMYSEADAYKIACMAHSEEDVVRFMEWSKRECRRIDSPLIAIAMGEQGIVSRVCAFETGTALTFASVGEATAPGQISITHLRQYQKEHTDAQWEHEE